jgi:hypothetical protein
MMKRSRNFLLRSWSKKRVFTRMSRSGEAKKNCKLRSHLRLWHLLQNSITSSFQKRHWVLFIWISRLNLSLHLDIEERKCLFSKKWSIVSQSLDLYLNICNISTTLLLDLYEKSTWDDLTEFKHDGDEKNYFQRKKRQGLGHRNKLKIKILHKKMFLAKNVGKGRRDKSRKMHSLNNFLNKFVP